MASGCKTCASGSGRFTKVSRGSIRKPPAIDSWLKCTCRAESVSKMEEIMADSPAPGTLIAHYRVESRLGQGGMGTVYLAGDTRLDRRVALKVLPPDVAADPERMHRFVQEAK